MEINSHVMNKTSDQVLRAMTEDGGFRILTVVTTETVRTAADNQGATRAGARWLGELITGAVLIREAISPDRRVQVLLKDQGGRTRLVADAHPTGWNRGIVTRGPLERHDLEQLSVLEVLYTLPNDVLQQGIVQLPETPDVSAGLMSYLQESEQIVSTIVARTIVDGDTVRAAGGYLVQLMPGATPAALQAMTDALTEFTELESVLSEQHTSAHLLRDRLIGTMAVREMSSTDLSFGCNCSRERILRGLDSLPTADLEEMIEDANPLDIQCDACGKHYKIARAALRAMCEARQGLPRRPRHN